MHGNDFREDLGPTRGQWERIAREWCRVSGEHTPVTRLEATELLLRLQRSETPETIADTPAGAQSGSDRAESPVSAARPLADRVRIGGRRQGAGRG